MDASCFSYLSWSVTLLHCTCDLAASSAWLCWLGKRGVGVVLGAVAGAKNNGGGQIVAPSRLSTARIAQRSAGRSVGAYPRYGVSLATSSCISASAKINGRLNKRAS